MVMSVCIVERETVVGLIQVFSWQNINTEVVYPDLLMESWYPL